MPVMLHAFPKADAAKQKPIVIEYQVPIEGAGFEKVAYQSKRKIGPECYLDNAEKEVAANVTFAEVQAVFKDWDCKR